MDRARSTISSALVGANRILLAMLSSLLSMLRLCQRDRRGHAALVAEDARGVTLARGVLDQARVAGAEDMLGPVAQPDLELAGEDDHELSARRRVPVDVATDRPVAERDLGRGQAGRPLLGLGQIDRLDVRLPVGPRVESVRSHPCVSFGHFTARTTLSAAEAVECLGVVADDPATHVRGQMAELALEILLRV